MKIINLLFTLLFLLAAFLQLNDPDPVLWFILYLSGAILCTLVLFRKIHRGVLWFALAAYSVYAIHLFLSADGVLSWYRDHNAENIAQSMKAEKPWIEATREFFGLLLLCSAVTLNLVFRTKTDLQSQTNT